MKRGVLLTILTVALFSKENIEAKSKEDIASFNLKNLDSKFLVCKIGANQSPVDLNRFIKAELPKPKVIYSSHVTEVINKGDLIEVNSVGKSEIVIDNKSFNLVKFNFHTPSEHKIEGKSFPLEVQFIHKSSDGEYLIVSLLFRYGKENKALQKVLNDLGKKGTKRALKEMFNPGELFPRKLDYYRYNGSLTTPPCSEGVRWIILKEQVEASKDQIEQIHKIIGDNNRAIQPLNARVILK